MDIFLNHIIRSNLISGNKTDLNPVKFGWNSVDSVLMPYKCNCYTTRDVHCYLWLQEKMHWKISVQQVWRFMHRNLQLHRRKTLYQILPTESVGHCKRYGYGSIKVFSTPNFAVYGQNPRTSGKYVSEKNCIFRYFTHCDLFLLLHVIEEE